MGKPQSIGIVLEAPHVVFAVWLDLIITVGSLASFSPSASQVVWRTCCPHFGKPSIRVNKDPCIHSHTLAVSAFCRAFGCHPTLASVSLSTRFTLTALASVSMSPRLLTGVRTLLRITRIMSIQACRDAWCNGTLSLPGPRVARSALICRQA